LCLLVSSCHPAEAGVQAPLVEELRRAGACVDGVGGDGVPLWTAVTFGYTRAAEALVRCGARVEDPILAAALADLGALTAQLDAGRPVGLPRSLSRTTASTRIARSSTR